MLSGIGAFIGVLAFGFFATVPSSTNYTLKAFDFGNGGGSTSSTNYKLNAITNGQSGVSAGSTNYKIGPGLIPTQNANVPPTPSLTNPSSYYNRLKLVLTTGNNPTDAKYAIAISSDNYVTTYYLQPDGTLSLSFNYATNYQTYAAWGGASGISVLGLQPNTTYKAKVKAIKGNFTETSYGPTGSASTVLPTINFSVATSLSSTPPFDIAFNGLAPGSSVYTTNYDPILGLSTNALFGGIVYFSGQNNGLRSLSSSYTLSSTSTDLGSAIRGYGAQVSSTGQTSGGPISPVNPYDGAGDNVGSVSSTLQPLLNTANPIANGSANIKIKAKTDITVPSASDYNDVLTFVAAMIF